MKEKQRQQILRDAGGHNAVYVPYAVFAALCKTPEYRDFIEGHKPKPSCLKFVGVWHITLASAEHLGCTDFIGRPEGDITAKWPDHFFAA